MQEAEPPFFADEYAEIGFDEVFVYLRSLLGWPAEFQLRPPDDRFIVAAVYGFVVTSVTWDPDFPVLGGPHVINVRGDGWVVSLPETEFLRAEVYLPGAA